MRCCKHRTVYIDTLIQKHKLEHKGKELNQADMALLRKIESLLPLDTLVLFRQLAKKRAIIKLRSKQLTSSVTYMTSKIIKSVDTKAKKIDLSGPTKWFRKFQLNHKLGSSGHESQVESEQITEHITTAADDEEELNENVDSSELVRPASAYIYFKQHYLTKT